MIEDYAVFILREPTVADIRNYLMVQSRRSFSYREKGVTRQENPGGGFAVDRYRVKLGTGEGTWTRARQAIVDWRMFSTDWTRICWPYKRIEPGVIVAVLALHYGFWSLSAARIVYVVDEESPVRRYGFAYGTVGSHPLGGEERFLVEWLEDDTVWFEIYAASRPLHWVARFAYPIVRRRQRRFGRDALAAIVRAVNERKRGGKPSELAAVDSPAD
jgi:uncharacterized protein (UPF0548 family)